MISRLGVRARFTLLYGMAMIVTVVLLCGGIYFFVQRALLGQVENHLRKDSATINEYLKHDPAGLAKVADHGPILLFSVRDRNQPLVSSEDWVSVKLEETAGSHPADGRPFSVRTAHGRQYRVLIDTVVLENRTFRIAVAHGEESVRQTRKTLAIIILLSLPLAVAIFLAIGYVIAGRVLAPITNIRRQAEEFRV